MAYHPTTTALLLVDPYNDFLSDGGKLWPRVKAIAEEVRLLDHLREVVKVAREKGYKVYFVPHHRWEPGDYEKWDHPTAYQLGGAKRQSFAKGTWGARFTMTSSRNRVTSSSTSTGGRAGSPTPISICSSSSSA